MQINVDMILHQVNVKLRAVLAEVIKEKRIEHKALKNKFKSYVNYPTPR